MSLKGNKSKSLEKIHKYFIFSSEFLYLCVVLIITISMSPWSETIETHGKHAFCTNNAMLIGQPNPDERILFSPLSLMLLLELQKFLLNECAPFH